MHIDIRSFRIQCHCSFHDDFDGKAACGCFKMQGPKKPKKLSKYRLLKERIRQFSIWYFEEQDQLDKDFFMRRVERHKVKNRHVNNNKIYFMRCIYFLDAVIWIVGLVFLIGSSTESFGENTPFYKSKVLFRILGIVILFFGVFVLLFVTGFKHKARTKHHKPRRNFYILQKKGKNTTMATGNGEDIIKEISEDSGNEEDIDIKTVKKTVVHKQSKENRRIYSTSSQRQPLQFYKNVDSRQCSFELSPIASTSGDHAHASPDVTSSEHSKRGRIDRVAWTKSKWMRVDSDDSMDADTIPSIHDGLTMTSQFGTGQSTEGAEANRKRMMFQMRTNNTSSNDSGEWFHPASRSQSTKSKVSQASTISTCSETAPLVKR
ncbi:hypothetical protein ACF0H5_000936 [Mactra antiquata]